MSVECIIDNEDRIDSVGGDWNRFAIENGAPELKGDLLIGRSFLDFVSGNVTRSFVRAILNLVRQHQQPIELEYRCDSPTERRFMLMKVISLGAGKILFQHDLLYSNPRNKAVFIHRSTQRKHDTPVRCSMCNRINRQHRWDEPDQFTIGTSASGTELSVIYGICDRCLSQLNRVTKEVQD